jgi:hypothetical protein
MDAASYQSWPNIISKIEELKILSKKEKILSLSVTFDAYVGTLRSSSKNMGGWLGVNSAMCKHSGCNPFRESRH